MAGEWNDLNEILSMRRDKEHTHPHQKLHPGRGKGKCKGPGAGIEWREKGTTVETPRKTSAPSWNPVHGSLSCAGAVTSAHTGVRIQAVPAEWEVGTALTSLWMRKLSDSPDSLVQSVWGRYRESLSGLGDPGSWQRVNTFYSEARWKHRPDTLKSSSGH